jgi:hypothetical protein
MKPPSGCPVVGARHRRSRRSPPRRTARGECSRRRWPVVPHHRRMRPRRCGTRTTCPRRRRNAAQPPLMPSIRHRCLWTRWEVFPHQNNAERHPMASSTTRELVTSGATLKASIRLLATRHRGRRQRRAHPTSRRTRNCVCRLCTLTARPTLWCHPRRTAHRASLHRNTTTSRGWSAAPAGAPSPLRCHRCHRRRASASPMG